VVRLCLLLFHSTIYCPDVFFDFWAKQLSRGLVL
jgi:hypothetical protein